jgi:cobalt/nickel transport system permease protein
VHIPDGYLSPATCAALTVAVAPAWVVAARQLRGRLAQREVPSLALAAAFSFVIMMFNVPAPGGTTGHAVGAGLVAVMLGPAAAVVTTTVALTIQALLFGDGGVLALGANCFNIAVVMPMATYAVYQLLAAGEPSPARRALAAGAGAYVGLNLAALTTAIQFGLQPALAHDAAGTPLYCPYGLGVAIPAMLLPHLLVFGVVEAVVTGGVVLAAARAGAFAPPAGEARSLPASAPLWAALGALCLLSPLGLLAAGDAWGEWAPEDVQAQVGYMPLGLSRLATVWSAAWPDYALPGTSEATGYILAAIVGVSITAGLLVLLGRLLARSSPPGPA